MTEHEVNVVLKDIENHQPFIIIDDYDEDNIGSLALPLEAVNSVNLAQFQKYAKGPIHLILKKERFKSLNIEAFYEQIYRVYQDQVIDTFGLKTYSNTESPILDIVDAVLNPETDASVFSRPGLLYPVYYREGGVLKRTGHTEAVVDLAVIAQLYPAGLTTVLIQNDEPMKRDAILEFAKKENLNVVSIASLISYRKSRENQVKRAAEAFLPTSHGEFKMVGFENSITGEHHVALVKGDIKPEDEVLVRVHSECLTGDAFGSMKCDCGEQLQAALDKIEQTGKGVLLYMRQEGRGIGLINKIKAYHLQDLGLDTVEANLALGFAEDMRDYGIGAQILYDLGVRKVKLMTNNPLKLAGLSGFGIEITSREPIQLNHNERNEFYMRTKKDKMGHLLKFKDPNEL